MNNTQQIKTAQENCAHQGAGEYAIAGQWSNDGQILYTVCPYCFLARSYTAAAIKLIQTEAVSDNSDPYDKQVYHLVRCGYSRIGGTAEIIEMTEAEAKAWAVEARAQRADCLQSEQEDVDYVKQCIATLQEVIGQNNDEIPRHRTMDRFRIAS